MLPLVLTNIIPEQFALPRMLTDIDTSRTPTPPPGPSRAPTPVRRAPVAPTPARRAPAPAPPRPPTPARTRRPTPDTRESSLTPMESEDDSSDDRSPDAPSPKAEKQKSPSQLQVPRPSGANIHTVKSLFKELYPDLTEEEQETEYVNFRDVLNGLCARYLRASLALTHQDKDQVNKVYRKLTETFTWLAEYENHWPVAVCLQGKLHNSAARAVEKSTRKAINIIAGAAPARSARSSSRQSEKKRKMARIVTP
ncbi:hypothetical protein FB451DRAFT_1176897 [Mycena latifolia]|nr:hypothetical protein FB451DRAFT_1176897 [Mycena latifolia]